MAYSARTLIYAFRLPDLVPAVFGYDELHVFVIAAVGLQYSAVAFHVLPTH